MTHVFADTYYFLALLGTDPDEQRRALEATAKYGPLVTTSWVLCEVANFLHKARNRRAFTGLWDALRADPDVTVLMPSGEQFLEGVALYDARPDKDWSLTDCISFVVMERAKIERALTADHHFEQAGFVALLKTT
jgi:predicted nucleic acid-binding protein